MQNNTPRGLPLITRRVRDSHNEAQGHCRSPQIRQAITLSTISATPPQVTFNPIPSGARQKMVMQRAINVLTIQEQVATNETFTPNSLMQFVVTHGPTKFENYVNPMVHPVTGEIISSCKKLMNDLATAEVWQTAFGKDFGGMCQGDNKMGQKGQTQCS